MSDAIVLIPSRMASTRLPEKPLADIAGLPMIAHVVRHAEAAKIGPVVVACDDERIKQAVEAAGGCAVLTRADHESGSDRLHEALQLVDPQGRYDVVLNLQGDVPLIEPDAARAAFEPLSDPQVDIGTIMTMMPDHGREDPSFVKAVVTPVDGRRHRALYFTRATAPSGEGPLYWHIGVYAYRRAALERFVSLPPSPLERREKLEQLRALEAGMRIDVSLIDSAPMDVNTPEDLERARKAIEGVA